MNDDLARIAAAFRATMPSDGLVSVFRIDGLDRLGLPVVQAALIPSHGAAVIGYGFGATEADATVGALGELCEEVHVGDWIANAHKVSGSYADLVVRRGVRGIADPMTLCLPAGSDYTDELTLEWVEARRWPSGDPVLVPAEWVAAYSYQLGHTARLITPITNGLGAGLDAEHALAHGVLELMQRDGNVLSYRALDRGTVVELDDATPPDMRALVARLRFEGINVTAKLASTDFGMANLYVVGDDLGPAHMPIQVTACGEAPHPERDKALRKAMFEFVSSRSRKAATHGPIEALRDVMPPAYFARQLLAAEEEAADEEPRAVSAMAEWLRADAETLRGRLAASVFSERARIPFSQLPSTPDGTDSATRLSLLLERLGADGLELLWIDCSPPPLPDGTQVRVAKAIVPGLESETMSYHRIGWRGVRRLRAWSDPLILDAPRPGAEPVVLRPEDEARAGGPAWLDVAAADRIVGALYPLYREPGPFAAQLHLRQHA